MSKVLPDDEVARLNERFEAGEPREILEWALADERLSNIAIASAFQADGTAVIHMATQIRPGIRVLFLDTGFHFDETLALRDEIVERLGVEVVNLKGEYASPEEQERAMGPRLYERDPDLCCEVNKVQPFFGALRGLDAWITSLRRDSSPTRADSPIVDQYELEPGKWIVKVNPVANWRRPDAFRYLEEHDLPANPLYGLGYASIGCAPCTRLRLPGEPERAGRWADKPKWECGIHQREAAAKPTSA